MHIDIADVAAVGIKEALQAGGGGTSLHTFLEALLIPAMPGNSDLIWLNDGPGVGTEMKRGFSAILGRFFARWYLEEHHGFTDFVPIDDAGVVVSHNALVRRTGDIYLPDWLCLDGNGDLAVAEAKGSHAVPYRGDVAAQPPLKKANTQIRSARVFTRNAAGQLVRTRVKGWGVMSSWGTQTNNRDPLLYALDPETEGESIGENMRGTIAIDIKRAYLANFMEVLGHPSLAERLYPSISSLNKAAAESDQLLKPKERIQPAFFAIDENRKSIGMELAEVQWSEMEGRSFVGGVIDLSGRLVPESVSTIVSSKGAGPAGLYSSLYYIGFDVSVVEAALQGRRVKKPRMRQDRSERAAEIELPAITAHEDGFLMAPLEVMAIQEKGPSDLLSF